MESHFAQRGKAAEDPQQHEAHLERMVDYYRRTADEYNKWHYDADPASSHNYAVRQVLQLLEKRKLRSVLDVCCGTGRCVATAITAGYDAAGIDVSQELLDIARAEFGISADKLTCGDATQLPFPDDSFDLTCVLGALHHTAMPRTIVEEMIRVSRHGIVISDEANHLHGAIRALLIKLHIFEWVYRVIFRRAPRVKRRLIVSEGDGPTFDFTVEEIVPLLQRHYPYIRSMSFVRVGKKQFRLPWWPRLFSTQAVLVATKA